MTRDVEQEARHKVLVLEAFDALFNRRDFEAAERYWSPGDVQHSAGIGPGRDGLFALVHIVHRRYESGLAVAEGDHVMVHGRYSGGGRPTRIVVDILRIEADRSRPAVRDCLLSETSVPDRPNESRLRLGKGRLPFARSTST